MEKFRRVVNDLIKLFEESLSLEHRKLKAIEQDRVADVEECMKQEQALVMKLRGLDQKRLRVQKELGWEGKNFRQIIEVVPQEERLEMQQLLERLERAMLVFQDTNQSAMDMMKIHLREIEKVIKFKDPEGQYSQEGNPLQKERFMTNKRV